MEVWNYRLISLQDRVKETNFLVGLTLGGGSLALGLGDVDKFELAAGKPARAR